MKKVTHNKMKWIIVLMALMANTMSFAQDNRSLIIRRAEAFIKEKIQKGSIEECDINYLKTIPLRTDISCETEFGFLVPHDFGYRENETVIVPKRIWIFPWADFIQIVGKKIEECPLRKKDPYSICHLLGVPEGSKMIYVAKITLNCNDDIKELLFRPAYQTDITLQEQEADNHVYKWNVRGLSEADIKFIKDSIINEQKTHYPITTCFGYTLDLDYFNTIEYVQQEELNDGTRRAKDYVGVPEYILRPNTKHEKYTKYTIRQIYDQQQIFNEAVILQKQKVTVHLKYGNWIIEGDFYPSQNYLNYKPGNSSSKESENKMLVELFNKARAGHKPEVSITFLIDNIERTVSRKVSRVDWLMKSIYF